MDEFKAEITACLEVLKKGGLILYPTDGVWGIGCDATNPEAVNRIYSLKQRPDSKSMIVLLDSERRLLSYVQSVPDAAWDLIEYSEKPLTIIYDNGKNLAFNVIAQDGSVGIRITKDRFCQHLIERFRKPLVATSANTSGQPSPANFSNIEPAIVEGVDYVVNLRQNEQAVASPSTIIRLKDNGEIQFIRK